MRKMVLVAVALAFAVAMSAYAGTIDFGTGLSGAGGTVTLYADGNLSGTNIPIGSLTAVGLPANDGVYVVGGSCGAGGVYGCLSFSTGGLAGANFITINGSVAGLGISLEALLNGTISSFGATTHGLTNAEGPDTKAADLLAAFGIPANQGFNFFGFSLTTANPLTVGSPSPVSSTDMLNSTPEPASVMLFGSGLVLLGGAFRRRLGL